MYCVLKFIFNRDSEWFETDKKKKMHRLEPKYSTYNL